jgi:hypothetical protein
MHTTTETDDVSFADDFLPGAEAIAEFYFGPPVTRKKKRQVYYRADRKLLPIFHVGNQICSRKSLIRADHAKRAAEEA